MTQLSTFFPLLGGLDQVTQAIAVPSGRAIAARNYESVSQGYGRVCGYERYDGQSSPTDASKPFDDIGDAAGATSARNAARSAIQKVPGSGPVRGVWAFNGNRYAWRDNVAATACVMWMSSAAGWVQVNLGWSLPFTSGGVYETKPGDTIIANTGAGTATVANVVLTSGTWAGGDAAGYMVLTAVTGTFTPGTLKVGANTDVATFAAAPVAQSFPPGGRYSFVTHNFYGNVATKAFYGVNGVGPGFACNGTTITMIKTGSSFDLPHRVASYKGHLFFAFRGGSVQYSQPGEPLLWSGTFGAGEIAIGDEVADFISNTTDSLTILSSSSVLVLTGTDNTDFALSVLTDEAGALPFTAQRMGTAMYLDNRGLRSLATTQAYGNFKLGTLTQQVQPLLDNKRTGNIIPVASTRVRNKDQYRLFYSDGSGISVYLGRKNPEPMPFAYPFVASCICSIEDVDNNERIFAGGTDGYVYELEVGRSFDGAAIEAVIQLPYVHEGSPRVTKRWHKAIAELVSQPETQIAMVPTFDYASADQPSAALTYFDVSGSGGIWDIDDWNTFIWSAPVEGLAECWLDGVGANMALTIICVSDNQRPHILQGMTFLYSMRGQKR